MKFAFCNVTIAPIRNEPSHKSEMISQLLFGEDVEIVAPPFGNWLQIRCLHDGYMGWVDEKQIRFKLSATEQPKKLVAQLVDYAWYRNSKFPLVLGSEIPSELVDFEFNEQVIHNPLSKSQILGIAMSLINTPYLWGGRSPFGLDCSGFVQLIYKFSHTYLPRDAHQQANVGEILSFLEETEPGDLAFFDDEEGKIVHVGLLLSPNQILHAHGIVRVDTLDSYGIFNTEQKKYTHRLRLLRRVLSS